MQCFKDLVWQKLCHIQYMNSNLFSGNISTPAERRKQYGKVSLGDALGWVWKETHQFHSCCVCENFVSVPSLIAKLPTKSSPWFGKPTPCIRLTHTQKILVDNDIPTECPPCLCLDSILTYFWRHDFSLILSADNFKFSQDLYHRIKK